MKPHITLSDILHCPRNLRTMAFNWFNKWEIKQWSITFSFFSLCPPLSLSLSLCVYVSLSLYFTVSPSLFSCLYLCLSLSTPRSALASCRSVALQPLVIPYTIELASNGTGKAYVRTEQVWSKILEHRSRRALELKGYVAQNTNQLQPRSKPSTDTLFTRKPIVM